jgi:ribonuclease VapC
MILDSSAIVAILKRELGFQTLVRKLAGRGSKGVSAPSLVEVSMVMAAVSLEPVRPAVDRFLQEFELTVIPFGAAHWHAAMDAFLRFGKGRHPAALNFGDCMSYAAARLANRPLLFVGEDFAKTDVIAA